MGFFKTLVGAIALVLVVVGISAVYGYSRKSEEFAEELSALIPS